MLKQTLMISSRGFSAHFIANSTHSKSEKVGRDVDQPISSANFTANFITNFMPSEEMVSSKKVSKLLTAKI